MAASLDNWLLAKTLRLAGNPPIVLGLRDGASTRGSDQPPVATVTVQDRSTLLRLLLNPELYFGDAYRDGHIDVDGAIVPFLESVYRARRAAPAQPYALRALKRWQARTRPNSLTGSKDHIHHHYDIGNDFYRLWLDREMQYTCAYFPTPEESLETAQVAKMDHVCRKLRLKPGETVVEAGCGWGGLALHMAHHYGVRVTAYNISHQQLLYARKRAEALGLAGRIEFVEDDYRNITGQYDAFVSVGMLEHVGPYNYETLGRVVDRVLKPAGRGLIHTIGRNRAQPMNAWIQRRIFPGAYPPTLREMMAIFEPCGFSVLDVENLRLHYAKTLEHWLARFEGHVEDISRTYDASFVRSWRLYLAGSIASFTTGWLQLFQVVFTRAENNAIPWTRAHLYVRPEQEPTQEPMDQCDVLIVGGGPAGSTCAWSLRRAGFDVVVLDKKHFPRDKVCAGWITPAVVETLEIDPVAYRAGRVMQPITGFLTSRIGGAEIRTDYGQPVSYGIRRCEFDHYLLQRSGARLRLGEPLAELAYRDGLWIANAAVTAPVLVGAGGHFCPVARRLGARVGSAEAPVAAQEIEFEMSAAQQRACTVEPEIPELFFTADLKGYGWVLRKEGILNVGLGRQDPHRLATHVARFLEFLTARGKLPPALPGKLNGHAYLLYTEAPRPLIGEATLLVGDAAGLAYPQSGEGIRPAIESGLLAAAVIAQARGVYNQQRLQPYVAALTRRFGRRDTPAFSHWLPDGFKQSLAGVLLASHWFSRKVVLDQWFLHRQQAPLPRP